MLNFFNNKKEDNRENCYLFKSGLVDKKNFDEDKLELYNDLLRNDELAESVKELIQNFLIPYKISLLKFTLNKDYYENGSRYDFEDQYKHIAPSLKIIKQNPLDVAKGYPSWFFIAFPDVAVWAMNGGGRELILKRFQNLTKEELSDGYHIRANLLNDVIKLYQINTNKPLECKKY